MNRIVAFTLLLDCNSSGFTELRSIARCMAKGGPPETAGRWPGVAEAEEYAAALAATFYYIRHVCSHRAGRRRPASWEILTQAWAGSGDLGRHWMEETLLNAGHGSAVRELRDAGGGTGEVAESSLPFLSEQEVSHRRWRLLTCWCDDIALEGLAEIHRLVAGRQREEAAEAIEWGRIAAIADACHRVPFPGGNPLGLNAIQFPSRLEERWGRTSAEGREWVRECSASLPHGAPRAIRKVLERRP